MEIFRTAFGVAGLAFLVWFCAKCLRDERLLARINKLHDVQYAVVILAMAIGTVAMLGLVVWIVMELAGASR
jgi:hypothetical protein